MDNELWERETNKRIVKTTPHFPILMRYIEVCRNVDDLILKLPAHSPYRESCRTWGEESMRRLRVAGKLFNGHEFVRIQSFIQHEVGG